MTNENVRENDARARASERVRRCSQYRLSGPYSTSTYLAADIRNHVCPDEEFDKVERHGDNEYRQREGVDVRGEEGPRSRRDERVVERPRPRPRLRPARLRRPKHVPRGGFILRQTTRRHRIHVSICLSVYVYTPRRWIDGQETAVGRTNERWKQTKASKLLLKLLSDASETFGRKKGIPRTSCGHTRRHDHTSVFDCI